MPLPRAELGLHELGTFELGYEPYAIAAAAEFSAVGQAAAVLDSGSFAQSQATSPGVSTLTGDATTVAKAETTTGGLAAYGALADQVVISGFSGAALAQVTALSGLIFTTGTGTGGLASASFDYLDGPLIDARGRATADFRSQAVATILAQSLGEASALFGGTSWAQSGIQTLAGAQFNAAASSYAQATLSAPGDGVAGWVGQRVTNVLGVAAAQAGFGAVGSAVAQAGFQTGGYAQVFPQVWPLVRVGVNASSQGVALFDGQIQPKVVGSARWVSEGTAVVALALQGAKWAEFMASGGSLAHWMRGRQVLPYLNPAEEVVEHPEELRGVERPEEVRMVERI